MQGTLKKLVNETCGDDFGPQQQVVGIALPADLINMQHLEIDKIQIPAHRRLSGTGAGHCRRFLYYLPLKTEASVFPEKP